MLLREFRLDRSQDVLVCVDRAARTAWSGWSPRLLKVAAMLSPMNFSSSPPNSRVISGAATPQYELSTAAAWAGVARSANVVNPTRSPKSTLISWRRSRVDDR